MSVVLAISPMARMVAVNKSRRCDVVILRLLGIERDHGNGVHQGIMWLENVGHSAGISLRSDSIKRLPLRLRPLSRSAIQGLGVLKYL